MAIKPIIARGIGFTLGSIKFIVTHGFGIGVSAFSAQPLKSLVTEIDSGLGLTLLPTGNTLSITQADTIPTVAPPGGKGLVCYITGGILTIYVWDANTNVWLS